MARASRVVHEWTCDTCGKVSDKTEGQTVAAMSVPDGWVVIEDGDEAFCNLEHAWMWAATRTIFEVAAHNGGATIWLTRRLDPNCLPVFDLVFDDLGDRQR